MNEIEKVSAYCLALINICRETNAKIMTINQKNVTKKGEKLGDWKITVEKV